MSHQKIKYSTLLLLLNIAYLICRGKGENTEAKLVLSMLKKENIKYCLFSTEIQQWADWTISDFKYLATNGIFTVFMKQNIFDDYLKSNVKNIQLGAAVIKTEDLAYWCDFSSDMVLYRTILANIYFIVMDTQNKKIFNQIKKYDVTLPYNSNFYLVTPDKNENYNVTEIYKNIEKEYNNVKIYGWYDKNDGLTATTEKLYERRFNMNGTKLVGREYLSGCHNRLICTFIDILEIFSEMMNFRSTYDTEPVGEGPMEMEGVIINPRILYFSDIDFIGPIFKTKYKVYVKDTFEEDQSLRTYSKPFSDQLWIYIVVWVVGLSIFHLLIRSIRNFYEEIEPTQDVYSIVFSPYYYLMSKSDINLSPKIPTRIVLLLTSLIALIISSSYTATFFSFIMIKKPKYPFTDLESFIEDGTYKIAATENTFIYSYFSASSDPRIKKISQNFLHDINDRVLDAEDGVYRLCNDKKFAFTCQPEEIYNYRHYCKIINIPSTFFQYYTIMELGKLSPFREIFNQNLMTVRSSGVLKKLILLIKTQSWETEYEAKTEVDFATTAPVLLLISYVYAASLIILFVEKIVYWSKKKNHENFDELISLNEN